MTNGRMWCPCALGFVLSACVSSDPPAMGWDPADNTASSGGVFEPHDGTSGGSPQGSESTGAPDVNETEGSTGTPPAEPCPSNAHREDEVCVCDDGYHEEGLDCVADKAPPVSCPEGADETAEGTCDCGPDHFFDAEACHLFVLESGDIVFQESTSSQSQAIQLATNSTWSHMGIVFVSPTEGPLVFEAIQPVSLTPYDEWVDRGVDDRVVVKRLTDASSILDDAVAAEMMAIGEGFIGADYDLYFEWSDNRIYCSELVWKLFAWGAGVEVGQLRTLGDFDLSHPIVQQQLEERFGDDIPYDEVVVSPQDMFDSAELIEVHRE